jgi:hypothetical protein
MRVGLYHFAVASGVSLLFHRRGCRRNPLEDFWLWLDEPIAWSMSAALTHLGFAPYLTAPERQFEAQIVFFFATTIVGGVVNAVAVYALLQLFSARAGGSMRDARAPKDQPRLRPPVPLPARPRILPVALSRLRCFSPRPASATLRSFFACFLSAARTAVSFFLTG